MKTPVITILTVLAAAVAVSAAISPVASAQNPSTTLVDVRGGHHPGFDRIVFEFSGPLPVQRSVNYVSRVTRDGRDTSVVGDAFLQVAMSRVRTVGSGEEGPLPTYGAARETYDLRNVIQVIDTRHFEHDPEDERAIFGIGLVKQQPIKVFTLRNPSRLVIDISTRFPAARVKAYFLDTAALRVGVTRYTPVSRWVDPPAVGRGALQRMFAGPTPAETARGLQLVQGPVEGFTGLSVRHGVARVRLIPECPTEGAQHIRREVELTLRQFPTVRTIQITC